MLTFQIAGFVFMALIFGASITTNSHSHR